MSEDNTKSQKQCGKKSKLMFAYGLVQLGSSFFSAIALFAIALSLCSINKESNLVNQCVEERIEKGDNKSSAVNYCKGG